VASYGFSFLMSLVDESWALCIASSLSFSVDLYEGVRLERRSGSIQIGQRGHAGNSKMQLINFLL
jgi:hypothetical protein